MLTPLSAITAQQSKPMKVTMKRVQHFSGDGFYLNTPPEHYRTHIVFVKKTRAKRLVDTVFFNYKYITQPTVMPADAIINAYQKLMHTIHGTQELDNNKQIVLE